MQGLKLSLVFQFLLLHLLLLLLSYLILMFLSEFLTHLLFVGYLLKNFLLFLGLLEQRF